ncbi:hypothetical protein DPMN_171235 [Dreissena polymorpha]|uniref:MATH domain-containing protein n=3 Tax=Dreissena polymorpha TaxID=45954 RepID=A0A9D4IC84_DREPO|nr:hypothetical protein DPMN_171235 [Dreissena polymorpha]
MAKLHRFVKLNDRFDSQVFTFALPGKVATDTTSDTFSKDIICGYHKWTVSFIKNDLHMGCFLKWLSTCLGMKCQIDFSFTLLNREHFTRNETFIEKCCVFTTESNQHGRKTFVGLNDLVERDFAQVTGDYLIELEMRKVNCVFESYIRLPREIQSRNAYETKLESAYFSFGLFDWSISLIPSEGTMQQDESLTLQLHRHTSFDHICNVRYYISLGENGGFHSEELDQMVDIAGNGELYIIGGSLQKLANGRSSLKVKVTMVSMVSVSEVTLNVASKSKNRAHFYDKDKQAWLVEADTTGPNLAFRLYYTDITHVPRKNSRLVCWNMLVLTRYIPEHKVQTNYGPFSRYYVQQDLDEGHMITTTIPVADLTDASCLYTEPEDPHLTLHIEWVESHLLATPSYHAHDDIDKLQKHQMRREMLALQSENLVLEKQLHSYQQSLAKSMGKDGTLSRPANMPVIRGSVTTSESSLSDRSTSLQQKNRPQEQYDKVTSKQISSPQANTKANIINKSVDRFVTPATENDTLPTNKNRLPVIDSGKVDKYDFPARRLESLDTADSGFSESHMQIIPKNSDGIMVEDVNRTTYDAIEMYGSPIDRQGTSASKYKTPIPLSPARFDERPSSNKNRRNSGTTKYDLDENTIGINRESYVEPKDRSETSNTNEERYRAPDSPRQVPRERKGSRGSSRLSDMGREERKKESRDKGYDKESSVVRMAYRYR